MSTKGAHYIQQLDEARCGGLWDDVPELVRKIRKHAPGRSCLTLTAEAEYAVSKTLQTRPTAGRPGTARPPTGASSQASPLAKYIPRLLDAIDNERTHVEDEFQARVCLGWIHWHIGEPGLAAGRLPQSVEQDFAQLDGTNKESAGWTKVCALKASYIKGSAQVRSGAPADALETFESALPIFATISTQQKVGKELISWAELYLTGFCMLSSQVIQSKVTPTLETETLSAFRSWARFWEARGSGLVGGRAPEAEVSRRQIWKEYYLILSKLLQENLPFPVTSLATTYASTSTRLQQRTELKRVEAQYEILLLGEVKFPKAEAVNEEAEDFVELVMQNWRTLCVNGFKEHDLGEGGATAISRGVLDILYRAATVTFHSTPVLRHLFTVHLAVADFNLAFKAFDTYMEIVKKGKARVEKTGEPEQNLDDDETVLKTVSECIKALCRYGSRDAAEKAKELGLLFEAWLEKHHPPPIEQRNGTGTAVNNGNPAAPPQVIAPKILALAWRCIGIGHAQWARFTYEAAERSDIQLHAIQCFRKALHPNFESRSDVETLFALGAILAERRELATAIEVVKSGLLPPQASSSTGLGPNHGRFARERALIPLWHLLALLLSARQDFLTAARSCGGAFEQFQDPKNLFGDADLSNPYRSDHLKEKPASQNRGVVDEMDDFEKESVLEVKLTQLALIEVLEGPEVAVNASDELLSLYARLFGDPQQDTVASLPPSTAYQVPPKSSAGTIRSIKGSIFGRSSRSQRKSQSTPALGERSAVGIRPQTSQPVAGTRAPVIQVTNENGNTAKQHHHLTKQHPPEKQKRSSSLSHKASGSARNRSSSASRRSVSHPVTTVDGEQYFTPIEHQDEWNADSRRSSDKAPGENSKTLPVKPQQLPQRQKSLKSANPDSLKNQVAPPSQASLYSSSTTPVIQFPKDQQRRRRIATLIKVWLVISGFYRRAAMYEDSKGAVQEAYTLTQNLETEVSNDTSGDISILNAGWGGGKSVVELWGDVFAERGYLAVAQSSPYIALEHFESSLTQFGDHPSAIVGLSNILLDIYNQDLLPIPSIPPLVLPNQHSTPSASTLNTPGSTTPLASHPTPPSPQTKIPHGPLGMSSTPTRRLAQSTHEDSRPSTMSSLSPSISTKESKTALLDRLAARDRAYGLLSTLTKLGSGWNYSEAWFALARAYELGGQIDKAKEVLWWCVELEEARPVRDWSEVVGGGGYVL